MRTIHLLLKNARGDELGRLPVPGLQAAAAGECRNVAVRPRLEQQMSDVYQRVRSTVESEGMEIIMEPLDLQIAVSQALLAEDDEAEPLIPLVVREGRKETDCKTEHMADDAATTELPDWDDLFRLDDPGKGK